MKNVGPYSTADHLAARNPRRYALYIFDFDYTLFDTSEGAIHCVKSAFAGVGVPIVSDDQIRRGIGLPLREFFGQYIDETPVIQQMERFFLRAAADAMVELAIPYSDTVLVANKLREMGSRLAICTGKYRDRVIRILAKHGIETNFDFLVCGDELVKHKPDPEGLLKCLANFDGIRKADVAYVGDHPYDIIAAQRCGIDSIAITTGSTPKSELAEHNPTYLIDDLSGLLE